MTTDLPHPPAATGAAPRRDRLTIAAGVSLLIIVVLHTAVFAPHPWWAAWLAGPFRTESLPPEAVAQFWGLPGGFVIPGALLGLLIVRAGRRGAAVPGSVGWVMGLWALACVWIVGPSGFLLLLVPAALLILAAVRARRAARS